MPGDPAALAALFDSHLGLGEYEAAASALQRLQAQLENCTALTRRTAMREYLGDFAGAVEAIGKACALSEASSGPVETQAWCQVRLGALATVQCREKAAGATFLHALAVFKQYPLALEHLAELRAAQGRTDDAISLYEELVQRNSDPAHRLPLADLYEAKGRRAAAARQRDRAEKTMRQATQAGSRLYLRPLAMLLLEDPATAAEGRRLAEMDYQERKDKFAVDLMAWALFRTGQETEAFVLLEGLQSAGIRDAGILFHTAVVAQATGRRDQARQLLEEALRCPLALRPADRVQAEILASELRSPAPP